MIFLCGDSVFSVPLWFSRVGEIEIRNPEPETDGGEGACEPVL